MPRFLIVAALLAVATAAQAQTKKEWVQKVLAAQQPGIEATGQQLAEQSALALLQRASLALRGVAADQREAVAKDIAADAKAFTDETVPVLRKRAVEVAPATIGPLLEQKFSEKELEQLHGLLTSPLYRKYQQLGGDMQRALLPAVMKESRATLEPKLRDLEQRIGQRLKAAPKAPAASAPAARPYNFSAGPATLPEPVLRQAAQDMLDWHGCGMGVMEMSHRGREFGAIVANAEARLRSLLAVPTDYKILFLQGGALAQNAIVPLNLAQGGPTDHVITGAWSLKTHQEALRYGEARVIASNQSPGPDSHTTLPSPDWRPHADARYVHLCSNETIHGVEWHELPDLRERGCDAPLVIDCSSQLGSRTIDWSRVGLAYAGAQKNVGPAGLTLVFVREDLLGHAARSCPAAFNYAIVAAHGSMYNTPPTYAIYVAGLVFDWMAAEGGVAALERRNSDKAALLYAAVDGSGGYYINRVAADCRSRMNVPFFLHDAALQAPFLAGAAERGLLHLEGHKSVGGLRASLYNAMPLAGVQALTGYMREFAARHG